MMKLRWNDVIPDSRKGGKLSEGEKKTRLQEWSVDTVLLEYFYLMITGSIPNGAGTIGIVVLCGFHFLRKSVLLAHENDSCVYADEGIGLYKSMA